MTVQLDNPDTEVPLVSCTEGGGDQLYQWVVVWEGFMEDKIQELGFEGWRAVCHQTCEKGREKGTAGTGESA